MTPTTLAAALRALAARASASSDPVTLGEVIAEGFTGIAATIEEGQAFMREHLEQLPLSDEDRAHFGLPPVAAPVAQEGAAEQLQVAVATVPDAGAL